MAFEYHIGRKASERVEGEEELEIRAFVKLMLGLNKMIQPETALTVAFLSRYCRDEADGSQRFRTLEVQGLFTNLF